MNLREVKAFAPGCTAETYTGAWTATPHPSGLGVWGAPCWALGQGGQVQWSKPGSPGLCATLRSIHSASWEKRLGGAVPAREPAAPPHMVALWCRRGEGDEGMAGRPLCHSWGLWVRLSL